MSKTSPTQQSMAALFTPESTRLRTGGAQQAGKGFAAHNAKPSVNQGDKPSDSLGNPNSPGYGTWGRKKSPEPSPEESSANPLAEKTPSGYLSPALDKRLIRLSLGWEKILVGQRKLCEKAKSLFTKLEGPDLYATQRKQGKLKKVRGCIVDVDSHEAVPELKEKKSA